MDSQSQTVLVMSRQYRGEGRSGGGGGGQGVATVDSINQRILSNSPQQAVNPWPGGVVDRRGRGGGGEGGWRKVYSF